MIRSEDGNRILHINSYIEAFRGKGIGTSIIRELIKKARDNNQSVLVGCFRENIRVKKLYLKLGFNLVRETASHYEFKLDA